METRIFNHMGRQIECAQASALKQNELLSLMSGRVAMAFNTCAQMETALDVKTMALSISTMPVEEKTKMGEILTEKAFFVGGQQVSIKDFQGKMLEWHFLLAELLIWNLADFFDLYSAENNGKTAEAMLQEAKVP